MILKYLNGNKQWLLDNIDELQVWSNILGYRAELDKLILNPLRNDRRLGSCSLKEVRGRICLIDFAHKETSGFDCVSAYRYKNPGKSWGDVCEDLMSMGQIQSTSVKPSVIKEKRNTKYEPIYREWTKDDKQWWRDRGVFMKQLNRTQTLTLPVTGYYKEKNNKSSLYQTQERCYCYHFKEKVKFYFPERKSYRFEGNSYEDDLWFLNRKSDTLIICKSHKDLLVMENLCDFNLTMVQSESTLPSSEKFYEWECSHKEIIIFMDNDSPGRKMAESIKKQILYLPTRIIEIEKETGHKDIDEFRVKEGFKETFDYLNYLLNEI